MQVRNEIVLRESRKGTKKKWRRKRYMRSCSQEEKKRERRIIMKE